MVRKTKAAAAITREQLLDAAERVFRELLQRYPKSELASSAQWMVDHMRTEDVPEFLKADTSQVVPKKPGRETGGK